MSESIAQVLAANEHLQARVEALTRDNAVLLSQYRKAQRQLKTLRIEVAGKKDRSDKAGVSA